MTVKTRATILSEIATFINDNAIGDVTPAEVRQRLLDLADSMLFINEPIAAGLCQGRLTLESGIPVSVTDQLAKTSVFFTPYNGNLIGLYNGATWDLFAFTEKTLSIAGFTVTKPYDIFIYNNAGVPALEALVWTNDTTRATALVLQDGVLCKSGALTRRYLSTIYTSATGQTQLKFGSLAAGGGEGWIGLWNNYNRVPFGCNVRDSDTSWTYATAAWRALNGVNTMRVSMIRGLDEDAVHAIYNQLGTGPAAAQYATSIGKTSVSTPGGSFGFAGAAQSVVMHTARSEVWGLGMTYAQALEYATGATATGYGDGAAVHIQNGLIVNGLY